MRYLLYYFSQIIEFFRELTKVRSFREFIDLIVESFGKWFASITLHYGCPNSKRTSKLQLKKTLFR